MKKLLTICAITVSLCAAQAALADGNAAAGKQKATVCAACHGANGISTSDQFPILAGQHTIRVFLSDSDITIAQVVVNETTVNLEQGKYYTFIHSGFMRPGQTPAVAAAIVEDDPPTPAAGKVAIRVLNLAAGLGAVDVFLGTTTTDLPSAAPSWTNVPFGTFTSYAEVDTAAYRVAATATGTATPLVVANTAAPKGASAVGTSMAIAGVEMAGSARTVVVFPPSVAGTRPPAAAGPSRGAARAGA